MVRIQYLGHACFLMDDGTYKVLVDPFLTGNPLAACSSDDVQADYIFVTHGHGDHVGDAAAIAKRTGAVVCSTVDLIDAMFSDGSVETVCGNIGGTVPFPFGSARYFQAIHGSGAPGTVSCGFVFEIGGKKIYHAGDTALMMDMQLLEEDKLDTALLPIGDYYTMGPKDALRAARMIKAATVIPMHYNTFPPIQQDAEQYVGALKEAGLEGKVLAPGESIEL